jgi:hypothetical protein
VASISCGVSFELLPGEYSLTFEHGLTPEQTMWANLYFTLVTKPVTPRILTADSGLSPPSVLVMDAETA